MQIATVEFNSKRERQMQARYSRTRRAVLLPDNQENAADTADAQAAVTDNTVYADADAAVTADNHTDHGSVGDAEAEAAINSDSNADGDAESENSSGDGGNEAANAESDDTWAGSTSEHTASGDAAAESDGMPFAKKARRSQVAHIDPS